jgi:hypothetical protein
MVTHLAAQQTAKLQQSCKFHRIGCSARDQPSRAHSTTLSPCAIAARAQAARQYSSARGPGCRLRRPGPRIALCSCACSRSGPCPLTQCTGATPPRPCRPQSHLRHSYNDARVHASEGCCPGDDYCVKCGLLSATLYLPCQLQRRRISRFSVPSLQNSAFLNDALR